MRGHEVRGWVSRGRWGEQLYGPTERWFLETGCRATQSDDERHWTEWSVDGSVRQQISFGKGRGKKQPPWLWGVTDQTAPTMPAWMKDDAQWQAALDAQK